LAVVWRFSVMKIIETKNLTKKFTPSLCSKCWRTLQGLFRAPSLKLWSVSDKNKTFLDKGAGFTAVDNISFQVEEGEIFGFLGPNGAGKTTTISMLCTLLKPSSGEAYVNGYNVVSEEAKVRQSIGIIFQDPSLDERLTAWENLKFHSLIYGIRKELIGARAQEVLNLIGLSEWRNEIVRKFSGGMKRRLEIARGLLHYPKVLFLDEPTLGLDPQTRRHIWDYIHELREKKKITIFLTTHYLDEAENCDRIAVIDFGQIIALDTPQGLRKLLPEDAIFLKTVNDEKAKIEIEEKYKVTVNFNNGGIFFSIKNGEEFIPELLKNLSLTVKSVNLKRPTLDDIFLKLTGREIREEKIKKDDWFRGILRSHSRR